MGVELDPPQGEGVVLLVLVPLVLLVPRGVRG